MKAFCHYKSDSQQLTSPFPASNGFLFRLYSGDVCDPYIGNWFKPPYFKYVIRLFCKYPVLPYFAYRAGNRAGYVGFKLWGVDSDAYKNWLPADEVYNGSTALCLTCRPFATI